MFPGMKGDEMYEEVTARRAGAWALALGVISVTVGIAVGVGCIVVGGRLLSKF